jgi:hypothetical protein
MPKIQTRSDDPTELIRRLVTTLDSQIAELREKRAQLGTLTSKPSANTTRETAAPRKRTMSAAAKAKISAAAKKRWAAKKKAHAIPHKSKSAKERQ